MLLTILLYIVILLVVIWTVVPTVRAHTKDKQKDALWKCASIWFISSLPIFVSLGFSTYADMDPGYLFSDLTGAPFSWAEQLVYSSTFLAPVIYAAPEALKVLSSDGQAAKKRRFKRVFSKYWRVLFPALGLMFVNIAVFSAIKVNPEYFKETVFYQYLSGKSVFIYLICWVYWYCAVLIEGADEEEDFAEASSERTQDVTDQARVRLEGGTQ